MPPGLARRESGEERGGREEEGEWCCERGKRKSNRSGLISGLQARVALSLSVIATGGWRMDVSLVMVPIFREPYDAGRRRHQQHLINHNLSRIRVHYHQEVVGRGHPPPPLFPLFRGAARLENETGDILRQQAIFVREGSGRLMHDCHGNVCPRCQGDGRGRGWNLAAPRS